MIRGLSSRTTSQPSPSRSIVPGAMFSTVTSAIFSRFLTISSPRGDFRLSVIDFLLALNWWKYQGSLSGLPGANRRPGSPVFGFSILTTSAPSQASDSVQDGPASNCVKSTTRTPSRQSSSTPMPSISSLLPKKAGSSIARIAGRRKHEYLGFLIASDRRIALERLGDALRIDPHLDPGALLLDDHRRARVAFTPAAVQRFAKLGQRHIGDTHRHIEVAAELGGERHVLVRQTQCKGGGLVFAGQELIDQPIEGTPPAAGSVAHGLP